MTAPAHNALASLTASRLDGKRHLLLAASGSVATIKIPQIINTLLAHHPPSTLSIRLLFTSAATSFLAGQSAEQPLLASLRAIHGVDGVHLDADEWAVRDRRRGGGGGEGGEGGEGETEQQQRGQEEEEEGVLWRRGTPILHIELRRWAHVLVIAPLSANTLAKIVGGLCDNLLTSVVRAWDVDGRVDGLRKRILVAPAMNTAMWLHPITAKHIRVLSEEWGVQQGEDGSIASGWFEVLPPQEKSLACGDVGDGAMKDWIEIVAIIESRLGLPVVPTHVDFGSKRKLAPPSPPNTDN